MTVTKVELRLKIVVGKCRSLIDDNVTQYGAEQPTVTRRNAARFDKYVASLQRLSARQVNASRERRRQGHVTGQGVAVAGSRGDSSTGPHAADGAFEVLWVDVRLLFSSRPPASHITTSVRVAMTAVVYVDRQLVEVVDIIFVTSSTICVQSLFHTITSYTDTDNTRLYTCLVLSAV